MRTIVLLLLAACGSTGRVDRPEPKPSAEPTVAAAEPAMTQSTLTVNMHGAGSVVGSVRSSPAGVECVLVSKAGKAEATCAATFAMEARITLTFTPDGSAQTAQFHVKKDGTSTNCNGEPSATSLTCELTLSEAITVEVYPISVPPPL